MRYLEGLDKQEISIISIESLFHLAPIGVGATGTQPRRLRGILQLRVFREAKANNHWIIQLCEGRYLLLHPGRDTGAVIRGVTREDFVMPAVSLGAECQRLHHQHYSRMAEWFGPQALSVWRYCHGLRDP
jgi:hypothetical protein